MQINQMIEVIRGNEGTAALPPEAVRYHTPYAAGPTLTGMVDTEGASTMPSVAFVVDCPCVHQCGEAQLLVMVFTPDMMNTFIQSLAEFQGGGYSLD